MPPGFEALRPPRMAGFDTDSPPRYGVPLPGRFVNRLRPGVRVMSHGSDEWYDLPRATAGIRLFRNREELREKNLADTEEPPLENSATAPAGDVYNVRTADGTYNDLKCPRMGSAGIRFGRNVPLEETFPDTANLMNPSPRRVSRELLTRTTFQPATFLNVIAAAWIQFMVHDWFVHKKGTWSLTHDIPLDEGDDWHERPMRVPKTPADAPKVEGSKRPPAYINENTHWWDGSHVYGSSPAAPGVAPRWPRRQGAGQPERPTRGRSRHREGDHRLHREWVGRAQPAPRAVCAGAQRDLRQAQTAQSALGRRAPVSAGSPRELGAARENPYRRVVDRDSAAGGPQHGTQDQLVRTVQQVAERCSRSSPTTTSSPGFPDHQPSITACRSP